MGESRKVDVIFIFEFALENDGTEEHCEVRIGLGCPESPVVQIMNSTGQRRRYLAVRSRDLCSHSFPAIPAERKRSIREGASIGTLLLGFGRFPYLQNPFMIFSKKACIISIGKAKGKISIRRLTAGPDVQLLSARSFLSTTMRLYLLRRSSQPDFLSAHEPGKLELLRAKLMSA